MRNEGSRCPNSFPYLSPSAMKRMLVSFKPYLPAFKEKSYFFFNATTYVADGKYVLTALPPTCMVGPDVIFHDIGSHCDTMALSQQVEAFASHFPPFAKQAKCFVGVDELAPYAVHCPQQFGNIEKIARNVWRVTIKNWLASTQYKRNTNTLVAALGPLGMSARDAAMGREDCLHCGGQKTFPFIMKW